MADDRYELLDVLGRGNFGVVVRARQVHLDRIYALKIIRLRGAPERVLGEARLLAALPEHDNVVKVHDAGLWDDNHVFIASELCTGGSLEDLAATTPLDPRRACDLISQACRGLGHLHHNELLHLDIRPANILIADGSPRLVDFGLARLVDDAEVEDWYSPHAAPELIEAGHATAAADIYSMAMTLAHLLTGGRICRPFPSGAELVRASADGEWPRVGELGVNVPARIRKLIDASTQYDPDARPRTIEEFKRVLDKGTPATSFLPLNDQGTLVSSDGDWSIAMVEKHGCFDVEVRRGGRRRTKLGAESVTAAQARSHVAKLVGLFADDPP